LVPGTKNFLTTHHITEIFLRCFWISDNKYFYISMQKQWSFTFFSSFDKFLKTKGLKEGLILGIEITHEIVAEILCSHPEVLEEITLHNKNHRVFLLKKIVFSFVTLKGKHLCRSVNIEQNTLIRHQKTKHVLFKHE
jgi:hypothetical protein